MVAGRMVAERTVAGRARCGRSGREKPGRSGSGVRRAAALALVALAMCAALGLCGCSSSDEKVREALSDGIRQDMLALKTMTTETAETLFATTYTEDLKAAGIDPVAVYGPLFENLAYSILDIQVDGDRATVLLTVANKDLTTALQNYTATVTNELATQASREALATLEEAGLTRHLAEVMAQCVQASDLETVTTTVELQYVKDGLSWELQDSTELTRALLGGLDVQAVANPSDAQLDATAAAAQANVASVAVQSGLIGQNAAQDGAQDVATDSAGLA